MEVFGIEITQTQTAWAAGAAILTSIGTTIKMFMTIRDNKRLKDAEVRKAKIENVDLVNNFYGEAFEHAEILMKYQKEHFMYYVKFCDENIADFIKFISNIRKTKNENRNKTDT